MSLDTRLKKLEQLLKNNTKKGIYILNANRKKRKNKCFNK